MNNNILLDLSEDDNNVKICRVITDFLYKRFDISNQFQFSKSHQGELPMIRHLSVYFSRNFTDLKMKRIADIVLKRGNHTNVNYSIKEVNRKMDNNIVFKNEINEIHDLLYQQLLDLKLIKTKITIQDEVKNITHIADSELFVFKLKLILKNYKKDGK